MRTDRELFAFDDEDLEGTIQPHDDTLVVTAQISGLLVKRIMINQGSRADVMYLDLFKRLGLKNQDLIKYDTPLVSFDERVVIPEGQISLQVNMEGKEVILTFIVVSSFSPYIAILGRLWIHTMGGYIVHITCKGKVSYRTRHGSSSRKSECRKAVPGRYGQLEGQAG